MQKITVTIPDNLTPQEELKAIAEHLGKKLLPSNKKLLGSGYEIKDLQTQINIVRQPVEKPIVTHDCPMCNTVVERKLAKVLYTNYGGKTQKHFHCSDECRNAMINLVGEGRCSLHKHTLKPVWHRAESVTQ
jgi:hypothetical protein